MASRPWTEDELKRARDMRAAGNSYVAIARVLRRRLSSTMRQLDGNGGRHEVRSSSGVPNSLLAEREALAAARDQRTLSQDFFGDPPPGYSALEGKTGQR